MDTWEPEKPWGFPVPQAGEAGSHLETAGNAYGKKGGSRTEKR